MTRLRLHLAGIAACLLVIGFFTAALVAEPSTTRPATPYEAAFCQEHIEVYGPVTGDCTVIPLPGYILPDGATYDGTIYEDDAFGRWDCRKMGNHICNVDGDLIIYFDLGGELHGFELSAPDRPACFMEPSNTAEAWEIIFYSRMSGRGAPEYIGDPLGFEVNCPNKKGSR